MFNRFVCKTTNLRQFLIHQNDFFVYVIMIVEIQTGKIGRGRVQHARSWEGMDHSRIMGVCLSSKENRS